jgi:hypothetical protein
MQDLHDLSDRMTAGYVIMDVMEKTREEVIGEFGVSACCDLNMRSVDVILLEP